MISQKIFENTMTMINVLLTGGWMIIAYRLFRLQLRTFASQEDTFKEQQKITDLNNKKFLYDIRPYFEWVQKPSPRLASMREGHLYEQKRSIVVKTNIAYNLRVENNEPFFAKNVIETGLFLVPLNHEIEIIFGEFIRSDFMRPFNLSIYFEDEVGTRYEQTMTGTLENLRLNPPYPADDLI